MKTPRMIRSYPFRLVIAALSFAATCSAGFSAPVASRAAVVVAATAATPEKRTAAPRSRAELLAAERAALAASAPKPADVTTKRDTKPFDTPSSPQSSVIDTLLRGEDARAAIASARDTGMQRASAPMNPDDAFGVYAKAREVLKANLLATRKAGAADLATARARLVDAIEALQAQTLLVELRLDADANTLRGKSLPASAMALASAQQQRVRDRLNRVGAAATTLASTLKASTGTIGAAVTAELDAALASDAHDAPAIYGVNPLPLHRPRLPVREPALTPAVVASYTNAEVDIAPEPADYAETVDAPLSATVLAQAASLGNDYTRIVDFVRSHVRTRWYAGAQQNADATLRTLSGNDIDQASLLIALLRASRAPARYVRGVVEVPLADLAASLGVRDDKVGLALAAAGVAHRPVVRGGRVAAYAIEHTFVSAYLPMSNYRGTSADLSGRSWIALAPALKPHRHVPAAGALARTGLDVETFITEHLQQPRADAPLQRLREQLSSRLAALSPPQDYAGQLAQHVVDAPPLELLPASLPVPVVAITGEFAQLPDALRQQMRVVVRNGDAPDATVVLDTRVALPELADRRVTLGYQPASIDDGAIVDAHGGMSRTPPYLYRVRPVLYVAGQAARAGSGAIETATAHRVEITFESPGGNVGFAQTLTAGGYAAFALDAPNAASPANHDSAQPGDAEQRAPRLLAQLGARYLADWNAADDELAALAGVGVVRPFPALALVVNQYRVERLDGLAMSLRWRGVALDAALRPAEAFAAIDAPRAEIDWTSLSALQGSALEHRVFEQQWSVASVSADKGLALARSLGRSVLTINAATGSSGVHQAPAVIAAIDHWLSRGYVVDVPADPLTLDAWSGAVWRVRSLSTGESGYFIAGQLAGGATVQPPELWYLQDLVAILGDPFVQPPNENPLAAAILTLDDTTQHQRGIVDELLPQPLRAYALDESGRPVKGATVTFRVTASDSQVIDAAGNTGPTATVVTDARGMAAVSLKLARVQGPLGHHILPTPDAFPQRVGHAEVSVSVATATGALAAGEPFLADMLPAAPAKIVLQRNLGDGELGFRLGYELVHAAVKDAWDNPVANARVDVAVDTDYSFAQCTDFEGFGPRVDVSVFEKFGTGSCPENPAELTGHACTTRGPLSLVSRSEGFSFYLAAGSLPNTRYTLHMTAGSASETVSRRTATIDTTCDTDRFVIGFTDTKFNRYGQVTYAGAPGTVIDLPYRLYMYQADMSVAGQWQWQPFSGAHVSADTPLQHGTIDHVVEATPGVYEIRLRAGDVPGDIRGTIFVRDFLPGSPPDPRNYEAVLPGTYSPLTSDHSYGWSVDLNPPRLEPDRVALSPFNTTESDLKLAADFEPTVWRADELTLQLFKDGELQSECRGYFADATQYCRIARGYPIDPAARYTAKTTATTPHVQLESEEVELHFDQGIIAGYGILPAASVQSPRPASKDDAEEMHLILGKLPTSLYVQQDVDTATGYVCEVPSRLGYVLSQPATVQIRFFLLDRDGNRTDRELWPQPEQQLDTGFHVLEIPANRLPAGSYQFEISARAPDGTQDLRKGLISSRRERLDALPLAHSFSKGVDLYSGGAVLAENDIVVGGRGPGMQLVRSYASHGGDRTGFFGRGWNADLDMQVLTNNCGNRIVTGGAGQGQRFVAEGLDPDGAERFRPMHGFHGSLVRRGDVYDFIARDGTRYHFAEIDNSGPRLSYIEDTNGNRVTYEWERDAGPPRVKRIAETAGRSIELTYETKSVSRTVGDIAVRDLYTVVTRVRGPDNLRVDYGYDDYGNLILAQRSDGLNLGTQRTRYTYVDYDGLYFSQPDGEPTYARMGFRLIAQRDENDGSTRRWRYGPDNATPTIFWTGTISTDRTFYQPELRVIEVTEPDDAKTGFAYDAGIAGALRGLLAEPVTVVTDARSKPTETRMNRYGAATRVTTPAGITVTTWDLVHLQPETVTDALSGVTTFAYDTYGNKTSEVLVTPHGEKRRRWTYFPPSAFASPHVTNRVETQTDPRNMVTTLGYDSRGNPTTTTRGGITTTNGYDAKGDRTSLIDGNGKTWLFRYDGYGFPREAQSPLGHLTKTTYDARGRQLAEIDANGHQTDRIYDVRDRVRLVLHPTTDDGTSIERYAYDDATRTLTHTDGRDIARVTTFDPLQRPLDERLGAFTRRQRYDPNGNRTEQTDFAGHTTTFEYDDANRIEFRHEGVDGSDVRTTAFEYDALGHVTRETVGNGNEQRVSEYRYEHPTYQRTLVRRRLDDSSGSRWIEESTHYDASGNPESVTDALNRTISRTFDARDRLTTESAPLGKTTVLTYDGRDQLRTETRSNAGGSGAQTRERRYDDDGRLSVEIDALNVQRTLAYDSTTNVTARSDGLGYLTRYRYDARNNLVEQKGPEAGQLTTYEYDGNNNRTVEHWANGRVLTHTYDDENRPLTTTDNLGLVEARTYWPDGLVKSVSDADGRTTQQFHDSLHRLYREELPGDMARTRTLTYTIHGDVKTEIDPRGHTTTIETDSLGRKTATIFPAVDGVTARTAIEYDDVGNVRFETNARSQKTEYRYNALNQRVEQIDPIECAAEGTSLVTKANNASILSHGTIAAFADAAKRLVFAVSAAIAPTAATHSAKATNASCAQSWSYDTEGNVLTHVDRRGITTTSHYDRENRLRQQDRAGLTLQTLVRDGQGNVKTQTDALSRVTTFTYDKAHRKIGEDRASLASEAWTYTPLGDVATHTDADARTTTNTYTTRRFLETASLAGETTRHTYDGAGHLLTRERPKGPDTTWTFGYDDAGNLDTVTDPLAHVTTFEHDENNNRTSITDANQHVTGFAYDERNRLKGKTYPGGASWAWRYDGDNNRVRSEAPNGRIATTEFDALNRPTVTTYLGAPSIEVQSTARTYDGNGNIRTIVEATNAGPRTESRDYDDFDRLTHAVDSDARHVSYRYDDVGNRTRLIDHDGKETVWTYNALNQNTRVFVPGIGTTAMTYTAAGLPDTITRPDGALTEHEYFTNGRLQTIRHSKSGTTLANYSYIYDPNGNRTEQRETNGLVSNNTTQSTIYRYDDADRLREVEEPGRLTTYTLDEVGNRTNELVVDGNNATISHSILGYNARDQLTSRDDTIANVHVVQTWDPNGNLATQSNNGGAPRIYTYDARDRLIAMTNPSAPAGQTTLAFAYHADGLRREKTTGTTTTRYQYDDQSLLAETNTLGNTLRQFHYSATQLVAQTQAGTTPTYRHYLLDALRSPIALLDLTGTITARTSYDAFGEVRAQQGTNGALTTPNREAPNAELSSTDDQPIGFTGYLKDQESGLYYAKARYYDPTTARFTTEDPEAGKDLEPPSLHRYLYAYANPTVYFDPTGRIKEVVDAAEYISDARDSLRNLSKQQPNNLLGRRISEGLGIAQGLLGLGEAGVDAFNFVANTALLGANAAGLEINSERISETENEFLQAGAEIKKFDQFLQDDGVFKTYDASVATTTDLFEGKNEAYNSVGETATMAIVPGSSTATAGRLRNSLAQAAESAGQTLRDTTRKAWQQSKSFLSRESRNGRSALDLERRMQQIPDSEFGPLNRIPGEREQNFVRFSNDYESHILTRDTSVPLKRGIGGAHDLNEFMKSSTEFRVTSTTPHPSVAGIVNIEYQMAARDVLGNMTGQFRQQLMRKTVFDPSIISSEDFLAWGRQAAAEAQSRNSLKRVWTGTSPNGVNYMGYLDESGAVRSFFPDF